MQTVNPKVFMIGQTQVNYPALEQALLELNVPEWHCAASDDHSLLTEFAGKSCYLSFDLDLNQNLTRVGSRPNRQYIQEGLIAANHGSCLEHASVTFFMTNISRVVTHELVRHRAGTAFSQTSGRYVREPETRYYVPKILDEFPEAKRKFTELADEIDRRMGEIKVLTGIDEMVDFFGKKQLTSAFRRLLGNGQANHLVMTANHRAWRHIIELRTSVHAEEEIRVVMGLVAEDLKRAFPNLYADMYKHPDGSYRFGGDWKEA